jgi:hypothetical protein
MDVRDRVKAMSIESPGGGASSGAKTGEIRLKQGFAEGGYNAGGYTGDGGKYEVKGYFPNGEPYHAGEYIIAQDELRQPMVAQWASRIETIRRRRTGKNAQPGFAEGGYTGNTVPDRQSARKDDGVSSRLIAILERIEHGDITVRTNYGVTELEAEQKRKMEAESKFTR